MIAVNFNLGSSSVTLASEIAAELRESGRVLRDASGAAMRDSSGAVLRRPGRFRHVKAIGWYIEEYGIAQVSMNIYDIAAAPLHEVFEAVRQEAEKRGISVTGSEIIGLVPLRVLLDAGHFYLSRGIPLQAATPLFHVASNSLSNGDESLSLPAQGQDNLLEHDYVCAAIAGMGLSDLRHFCPDEKVLEYLIEPR